MVATIYILGDADRVRERVEAALFAHDLQGLSVFSSTLTSGIAKVVRSMNGRLDAITVMAGGDDVLFTLAPEKLDCSIIEEIADEFFRETGCTISFGVGRTLEEAYLNLRRAKICGAAMICLGDYP